jgi:hypothetical protein
MKQYNVNYRKAGPLKIIRADGTVEIQPALKRDELLNLLKKSGNIKKRKK